MTEVAHVSKDHGNSMLISGSDNFIITNRTAWLNYAGNAYGSSGVNTVTEWEKGVRSHNGTRNLKIFIFGFNTGNLGGINPAHLTGTYTNSHIIARINDGV